MKTWHDSEWICKFPFLGRPGQWAGKRGGWASSEEGYTGEQPSGHGWDLLRDQGLRDLFRIDQVDQVGLLCESTPSVVGNWFTWDRKLRHILTKSRLMFHNLMLFLVGNDTFRKINKKKKTTKGIEENKICCSANKQESKEFFLLLFTKLLMQ